jgi:predicted ATPase
MDEAVQWWLKAGQKGVDRSACLEATAHLRQGLTLLDSSPSTPERRYLRLKFLILLAPTLIPVMGPGTAEVERLYAEAVELCRETRETPEQFPVYWGWWRLSRDVGTMLRRAESLLAIARGRRDDALLLQAHHCQWASHFNAAEFAESAWHIDEGLRLYDAGDYRAHASLYGNHDAKVCGHGERALILSLCGDPDRALEEERLSRTWARKLNHAGSISHSLDVALSHRAFRRDIRAVLKLTQAIACLAEEQGFSDAEAKAFIYRGWARSLGGETVEGLCELQSGIARERHIGTTEDFPLYCCMLAEALLRAGRTNQALEELITGRAAAEAAGFQIWRPELWRWEGRVQLARGDEAAGEQSLRTALGIARQQRAVSVELRVALDLARLFRRSGDHTAACEVLRLPLGALRGGRGDPDRVQASRLMHSLQHDAR